GRAASARRPWLRTAAGPAVRSPAWTRRAGLMIVGSRLQDRPLALDRTGWSLIMPSSEFNSADGPLGVARPPPAVEGIGRAPPSAGPQIREDRDGPPWVPARCHHPGDDGPWPDHRADPPAGSGRLEVHPHRAAVSGRTLDQRRARGGC